MGMVSMADNAKRFEHSTLNADQPNVGKGLEHPFKAPVQRPPASWTYACEPTDGDRRRHSHK